MAITKLQLKCDEDEEIVVGFHDSLFVGKFSD